MITLRKLRKTDETQLLQLIKTIEDGLTDKKFWLPINDISREHFLDDDWTYFLGLFDDEKLIGASGLFLNKHEFEESLSYCKNVKMPVAEIGRAMVLPEYRGHNFLLKINSELLKIAKQKNIQTILVTIHPRNLPSQRSFEKLGAKKVAQIVKYDSFLRDILLLEL